MRSLEVLSVLIVSIITSTRAQYSLTGSNRKKLTLKNFSDGKNGGNSGPNSFMGPQQGGVDYRGESSKKMGGKLLS